MMIVHELRKHNSIFNSFIAQIRDENVQKDRMRFRRNLERIGEVIGYEISKTFSVEDKRITTPLGEAIEKVHNEPLVLATILRAGLPLHQGLLNYFDDAENAFISAYRRHHKVDAFEIEIEYLSAPNLDGKTVILSDPMLATGSSMVMAYKAILSKGTPAKVYVVSAIASVEGVEYVKKHMPANTQIWVGAIDDELTAQAYIVPGLGDAGDLAFGSKDS
ncbi:MAG: uracil phosphoribosyltransferase [Bacteroidia bacterium]